MASALACHQGFQRANRRVKAVQIEFDRIPDRAKALIAEQPKRDSLTDAEIKLIADYHYAERLHADDEETCEDTGRDERMWGYRETTL